MKRRKNYLLPGLVLSLVAGSAPTLAVGPDQALTILARQNEKTGPISVNALFTIQNGKQAEFEKLLPQMKAACEAEKGHKIFAVARPLEKTTVYSVYTVWETVADLKAHLDPTANAELKKRVGAVTNGSPLEAVDLTLFGAYK